MNQAVLIILAAALFWLFYVRSQRAGKSARSRRDKILDRYYQSVSDEIDEKSKSAQKDSKKDE